jgi:hypothetical protein
VFTVKENEAPVARYQAPLTVYHCSSTLGAPDA